jgi:acyl-CoA thioester hydrolase
MEINFKNNTKVRVRYGETDQMGYCYYGNYAQYFEVGRVEAMRSLGCSYKALEEDGVMLPVHEFQVKYHRPAYYDDLLTIETTITRLKGPKIIFGYKLYNEDGILLSEGMTSLVFVHKVTMRPIAPPPSFLKQLNENSNK